MIIGLSQIEYKTAANLKRRPLLRNCRVNRMCQFPIIYLFVTLINAISFDIERDLIINPTSEGTSAPTAPAPIENSSAT